MLKKQIVISDDQDISNEKGFYKTELKKGDSIIIDSMNGTLQIHRKCLTIYFKSSLKEKSHQFDDKLDLSFLRNSGILNTTGFIDCFNYLFDITIKKIDNINNNSRGVYHFEVE